MPASNQAILLTPPGSAAIAVVRLVGAGVAAFASAHFSKPLRAGRCVHGNLVDGARVIDDAVAMLDGESGALDLNIHGGPWVVRSTLELAARAGFSVVESPGVPLPDEAVDGATPLEREIVAHLPLAKTELALRRLLEQEELWGEGSGFGVQGSGVGVYREREKSRSRSCTGLNPSPILNPEPRILNPPMLEDRGLWWLLHPPRVAIVGAANVGKSTLANQLFAQERSITADLPGTTRDWVGEIANLDGLAVVLIDTPGLRATEDPIEREAIERSGGQIAGADLVLLVLDASRPLEPEQKQLIERFPQALCVINKMDRAPAWDAARLQGMKIIATSGAGVDDLRREIRRIFQVEPWERRPRWWTGRQRQRLAQSGGCNS